ncbi:MAG: hypothetical protein R3A44_09430 [Caldilineaceae bacterium]
MAVSNPSSGRSFKIDFQQSANGFQFPNYGGQFPEGDMTMAEVHDLFGDQVCTRWVGNICVPTVEAKQWLTMMNAFMQGGHCTGFTVMGYRLFTEQFEPDDFTLRATDTYEIEQKPPIMRRIARNYAMYDIEEVWRTEVAGTPSHIVDELVRRRELADIGIFSQLGGHSLLAYGVEDKGDGIYWILVYDSNHPGQELHIEVDYNANTWRYDEAAVNPDQKSSVWAGDAYSDSLFFYPLAAYDQWPLTCPFCAPPPNTSQPRGATVAFSGAGNLLVRNAEGQQIGRWFGSYINTIPEAHILRARGAIASPKTPILHLPEQSNVLTIQTSAASARGVQGSLQVIDGGFTVAIEQLNLAYNHVEEASISLTEQQLHYRAATDQKPVLKLSASIEKTGVMDERLDSGALNAPRPMDGLEPHRVVYAVAVGRLDVQEDGQASLMLDQQERLAISIENLPDQTVSLIIVRLTEQGETVFATDRLPLVSGGVTTLALAGWDGISPLEFSVNSGVANGAGSAADGQVVQLENGFPTSVLADLSSAESVIALLGDTASYMSAEQRTAFIDTLTTLSLNAASLANVLISLRDLNLSDAELLGMLDAARFTKEDAAKFLFNLRLESERLKHLVDATVGSQSERLDLLIALARQEDVHAALVDWEYANLSDVSHLPDFLAARQLTSHQIADFLEQLVLSSDEVNQILAALAKLDPTQWPLVADVQPQVSSLSAITTPTDEPLPTAMATNASEETASSNSVEAPTPTPAQPAPRPTSKSKRAKQDPAPTVTPTLPATSTSTTTPLPPPSLPPTALPTGESTPLPTATLPGTRATETATSAPTPPPTEPQSPSQSSTPTLQTTPVIEPTATLLTATNTPKPPTATRRPGGTIPPGLTRAPGGTLPPVAPSNGTN